MAKGIDPDILDHFAIQCADTPQAMAEALRVRYEVYCQELGYESGAAYPDCAEHDAHDVRSRHALVVHRATGLAAGCVRLVLPEASGSLPILAHATLDSECPLDPRRQRVAEVSRLAVRPRFRHQGPPPPEILTLDGGKHWEGLWDADRQWFPSLGGLLSFAAVALFLESGADGFLILSRPALARLLNQLGIAMQPAGPEIEFRGRRRPYWYDRSRLAAFDPSGMALLDTVRGSLCGQAAA